MNYCVLPWITPDDPALSRITTDYFGLLQFTRIAPDYQFRSPSFPADYQSCFSLGITANYSGLRQNTLNYSRLLQFSLNYAGLSRITPIHFELLRITPDFFGLLRISRNSPDYQFGSPSGPTDYQNCFPFGITANYCGLRGITPEYTELLQLTSIFVGLRQTIADYSGLLGLPRITNSDHQVVQRITRVVSPSIK